MTSTTTSTQATFRRQRFKVTLLEAVVLTERSATVGVHKTLHFVPGSKLLGAAAGRLYMSLGAQAWDVFHSGRVRFGDALPVFGDASATSPTPLAFHRDKLRGDAIHNLAHPRAATLEQPKQHRQGYINASGERLSEVPTHANAKVAVARRALSRTGTPGATKNQLFAYEAIAAGTCFVGHIDIDAGVSDALIEDVLSALERRALRLGRSRRAEYGGARFERLGALEPVLRWPDVSGSVSLLLRSDLALRDPVGGQPTLNPTPEALGMPQGTTLDLARTFVRSRRYSPFNGHRKRPDLERQVLVQGSVLTFTLPPDLTWDPNALAAGVGDYREQGLGQVEVNPLCLSAPTFAAHKPGAVASDTPDLPDTPSTRGLAALIRHRSAEAADDDEAFRLSRAWASELAAFSRGGGGPSRAQWGTLRQLVAMTQPSALYSDLFDANTGALRSGVAAHAWAPRTGRSAAAKLETYATTLRDRPALMARVLGMTAARVLRELHSASPNTEESR